MTQEKKLRIGVVGIGHLGGYHLQKYARIGACTIAAVSDSRIEKAQKAADLYGCPAFADHRDMLELVDAVSIAVPTGDHYAVARDFLAAGIDALIEKPLCAALWEADELLTLARKNSLILQVGFIERFNPAVMALEQVITRPAFVEVHRLHPFFERGTDVDVILDLMIHDLDLILKFVDAPVTRERSASPFFRTRSTSQRPPVVCHRLHRQHHGQRMAQDHAEIGFRSKAITPWTAGKERFCRFPKSRATTANRKLFKTLSSWAAMTPSKKKSARLSKPCGAALSRACPERTAASLWRWPSRFFRK